MAYKCLIQDIKRMYEKSYITLFYTCHMKTLAAVIQKEEDMFVVKCPEVGTVSQGYTVEEALANLKEATELYLDEFPMPTHASPFFTTFEVEGVAQENIE